MEIRKKITSKVGRNITWLVVGQVVRNLISFALAFFSARVFGPTNYGIIGYVSSYIAFFSSLCDLGINGIIVKEYVQKAHKQGEVMFTALTMKLVASFLSCMIFSIFMFIAKPAETVYGVVAILLSISVIFNSFDVIAYWYQSRLESKKEAIISSVAYIVVAIYKVFVLVLGLSIEWFAFATSLDFVAVALLLTIFYFRDGGQKWNFSLKTAKDLLGQSYHLILAGVLVAIFAQTDKIMIGMMMNMTEVGYYSTAVTIAGLASFIPLAIINSLRPVIMEKKKTDQGVYVHRIKQLYMIIIYFSLVYSIFVAIFAEIIVRVVYGDEFLGAVGALRIVVWYTTFSYLGGAKNVWLVAEGKQSYEKWFTLIGAALNVGLNFLFIPICGIIGAAVASLITQIVTNFIAPLLFKATRDSSIYMVHAFLLRDVNIHLRKRKEK